MHLWKRLAFTLSFGLLCAGMLSAQFPPENRFRITPGLGFEYLSRTLEAETEGGEIPSLNTMIFSLKAEFSLDRVNFAAFAGYSITGMDQMIFRQLPFSIELEAGRIGGLVFGGDLDVYIAEFSDIEITGRGRIVFSIGMDKEWALPGLAVEGTAAGSPNWLQITVGPVLTYTGFDDFSPYIFVGYERFSGSFILDETVETLIGSQERDLNALGKLHLAIGTQFRMSDRLKLNGEIGLIPHGEGVDWGFSLGTHYDF